VISGLRYSENDIRAFLGGLRGLERLFVTDVSGQPVGPIFKFHATNMRLNKNTDVMQQDADFITADFLYVFQASCAHHEEYKTSDTAATGTDSSVKYNIITLTS
jgi:hypothetical protein